MKLDLERAELLKVEPGDIVVLSLKQSLSREAIERVTEAVGPVFKEHGAAEVIVLDADSRLSVVRQSDG